MARIGNETSLVLKLAEARVGLEQSNLNKKLAAHFRGTELTKESALEIGVREGIRLYADTLGTIVRQQEER